jgi:membrane fusion protein (multidrug efflux system)
VIPFVLRWKRHAFVLLCAGAVAGCGGEESGGAQAQAPPGPGGRRGMPSGPVPVETQAVEDGRIARSVAVSGNVEPIRTVGVISQLPGALRTVVAEEGTWVEQGAVLATLDDREIAAQLASAEAAYELAQANFQRAERLRERQVITEAEYERDRAALAAAAAQRDQLRTRSGYATIRAPITGIVTEKLVEAGDVMGQQTRLFTIADLSTMVVRVRVSELDVVALSPGDNVEVALDAFPGRPLTGRIRRIFPAADPTSRLVPVEVAITGPDARIARPGFLARVTFALGEKVNVRLVPASAIVKDASGSEALFVVENQRAARRLVRTGLISAGRVEIVDGVDTGELVVVTGANQLRDGVEVRIVNAAVPEAARPLEGGPGR